MSDTEKKGTSEIAKATFARYCVFPSKDAEVARMADFAWQDIEDDTPMKALAIHANYAWRHERLYFQEELVFIPSTWTQFASGVVRMTAWDVPKQSDVAVFLST